MSNASTPAKSPRPSRTGPAISSPIAWVSWVLLASGMAGLINQVVWQRALKLYLGGSETISAMVVVLVFMLGLGLGSLYMGARVHRIADPAKRLALIELVLGAVTALVCLLLSVDLSESVYAFQRLALSAGIPLRALYGFCATALLLAPCFLMGLTLPLASETCQRQLGARNPRLVDVLFAVNTVGAVAGALLSSLYLLPVHGQRTALLCAAGANVTAGVLMLAVWRTHIRARTRSATAQPPAEAPPDARQRGFRREEWIGCGLGFLSLAYEMYLVRLLPLAHEPRAYTFGFIICAFLLSWSIGVYLASRVRERIVTWMLVTAATIAVVPLYHQLDRHGLADWGLELAGLPYFIPCVLFGLLFGQVIRSYVEHWGSDVGRYSGLNTIGSCLGILTMTLLGFELHYDHAALLIAIGFCLVAVYFAAGRRRRRVPLSLGGLGLVAAGIAIAVLGAVQPHEADGMRTYCGRDGVIEIADGGQLGWDGLWHSQLSDGRNHISTNNWQLAAIPIIVHPGEPRDALVIGMGAGVTSATLAKLDSLQAIDAYEINDTLREVFRDFRVGTLHSAENPKINVIWQDGRTGLALNTKRYDLITQQPLYLRQAGSSILLSQEYMRLVRARLKPGGIFCVYSNALGYPEQALVVRATVASVFPHVMSFGGGYCLVASNEPLQFDPMRILERAQRGTDAFWREFAGATMLPPDADGAISWECPLVITDDHPVVEYPATLRRLLAP